MKPLAVLPVLAFASLLLTAATGCGDTTRSDSPHVFERSTAEPLPPFITVNGSQMSTEGLVRVAGGPNLSTSGDFKAGMFTNYRQESGNIVLTYSFTNFTHFVSVAPSGSISLDPTPPSTN